MSLSPANFYARFSLASESVTASCRPGSNSPLLLHGDPASLGVPRQDHRQSAVPGHIARRSKAVLQSKDRQHQRRSRLVKAKHSGDQSQRRHDGSARHARRTDGNVVHYSYIEKFIENLGEKYNIREIAFDCWGAVQMVQSAVVIPTVLRSMMTVAFC